MKKINGKEINFCNECFHFKEGKKSEEENGEIILFCEEYNKLHNLGIIPLNPDIDFTTVIIASIKGGRSFPVPLWCPFPDSLSQKNSELVADKLSPLTKRNICNNCWRCFYTVKELEEHSCKVQKSLNFLTTEK